MNTGLPNWPWIACVAFGVVCVVPYLWVRHQEKRIMGYAACGADSE